MAAAVAGSLIAFYQMGYGIAAFGVGLLIDNMGLNLNTIYGIAVVLALVLAVLSVAVTRHTVAASKLDPRQV
jgi:hypothetical protein